jgi:hypothetical protein
MSALTVVQQFNFTSGLWKNLAPMAIAHYHFGCGILAQSKNEVLKITVFETLLKHLAHSNYMILSPVIFHFKK